MSEHDDVRRALDDLVGTPPISLGRRGAVMSRISKVNHRRRVATQATLSAFVVVAATFGAAQVITATPAGNGTIVEQPRETATPGDPAPTVAPTVKPTVKPGQPTPTAAPTAAPEDPKAEPTKAEPKPDPTYTKPKPTYAEPKPTTKEPVPGGLTVEFWPYDTAKAGAEMNWKVKAYDPSGRVTSITVHFGDGSSKTYAPGTGCGESVKQFAPHTYAKAGTYTAKAVVTTGDCGAATETKTVTESVKVLSADYAGNGPAAPTVTAQQVEDAIAKLALSGADSDGWVKKFYVDWGDGTETYAGPRPFDGCQDGKPSSWDTTASHEYAEPGTYTVKVTVLSTNCDAGEGQTTTISLTVTV